jgi:hypothetical protein
MMRQVLKWVALVLSGIAVLTVAAYAYYWYSPPPQIPTLSSAIQRATLHVGDSFKNPMICSSVNRFFTFNLHRRG